MLEIGLTSQILPMVGWSLISITLIPVAFELQTLLNIGLYNLKYPDTHVLQDHCGL